jgi:hypothetical protein
MALEKKLTDVKRPIEGAKFGAITSDPTIHSGDGSVWIEFDFQVENLLEHARLEFVRVRDFEFTAEGHTRVWDFEGAYNALVEVEESTWVRSLVGAQRPEMRGRFEIRHFMIYIEDSGSYKWAAADFELVRHPAKN